MMGQWRLAVVIGMMVGLAACAADGRRNVAAVTPAGYVEAAPLLDDLGSHHHPVSTDVPLAQRYFDQGLTLVYGFDHAEAARWFREAQRLDPQCAMASWGDALVRGPNINAATEADRSPDAGTIWDINTARHRSRIAEQALAREVAARRGDFTVAIERLRETVARKDALRYDEPAPWAKPSR